MTKLQLSRYKILHFNAFLPLYFITHCFCNAKRKSSVETYIVSYISMSRSGRETRCSHRDLKSRSKSYFNNHRIKKLFYERSGYSFIGYMFFIRGEKLQNTIHDTELAYAALYQNIKRCIARIVVKKPIIGNILYKNITF